MTDNASAMNLRTHPALDLQYHLLRSSRRKSVVIEVHRDQSVKVRAPLRVSQRDIHRLLGEKIHWIRMQQHKQALLPQPQQAPGYTEDSCHYFMGAEFRLAYHPDLRALALTEDGRICLPDRYRDNPAQAEKYLSAWYRKQAQELLQERLTLWNERIATWNVVQPTLRLRFMRRYWGSCNRKGMITLNVNLVKIPLSLMDYVVTHELCHLREMNHSPRFYALQEQLLPEWRSLRKEIRLWEQRVLP
ncbi:SprT family zinc-dependent metalloprotease [Hahella aquimaris]|uniref:M48 family metallopeptidase n=1 Tax=Hahella sp. HNIBRBA332 TaxID=3015983 RepID=UPI00273CD71D|nr:SprT family zinc-dependent metalloprotease [Hahella sp. HNIBRBA332]WLQ14831.1 SprT family zinc-dependent metalloprotease [Hahella sp. HNIBRBA332]